MNTDTLRTTTEVRPLMAAPPERRIGILVPPGNPTTEPEVIAMAPATVSVHFTRMVAQGTTGSLDGQEERNRSQIEHLPRNIELLALVKPAIVVLAHTATSYTLGLEGERELRQRIRQRFGFELITAFGSVVEGLRHLGVRRVAYGTPYGEAATRQCGENLSAYGFEVVNRGRLPGVTNIYDETPERAASLARQVDSPSAEAIFLSGVGMPTVAVLERLEAELGKPVISSTAAMMWNALRALPDAAPVRGFGRLLGSLPA